MGLFEILLLAGFVLLFLFIIDHGGITLKALQNRWVASRSRRAKVLPFAASRLGSDKTAETHLGISGIESNK